MEGWSGAQFSLGSSEFPAARPTRTQPVCDVAGDFTGERHENKSEETVVRSAGVGPSLVDAPWCCSSGRQAAVQPSDDGGYTRVDKRRPYKIQAFANW
jgi:hypothetical protein